MMRLKVLLPMLLIFYGCSWGDQNIKDSKESFNEINEHEIIQGKVNHLLGHTKCSARLENQKDSLNVSLREYKVLCTHSPEFIVLSSGIEKNYISLFSEAFVSNRVDTLCMTEVTSDELRLIFDFSSSISVCGQEGDTLKVRWKNIDHENKVFLNGGHLIVQ